MAENNEGKFDEFLDSALADYSNVEPRTGLEGRILARLSSSSTEAESRTWLRWWPGLTFAAAAAIALIVFFAMPRKATKSTEAAAKPTVEIPTKHEPAPQVGTSRPPQAAALAPGHVPSAAQTAHEQPHSAPVAQVAVAKQPVFPAPSPLSEQERLLFAYMRKTDRAEIAANAKPDVLPALQQLINEQQINQVLPGQRNTDTNTNTR